MTNFVNNCIKAITFPVMLLLFSNSGKEEKCRRYFNDNFDHPLVDHVEKVFFQFKDTIPNDTLYVCYSNKGLPLATYRDICTGVCDSGECKIVRIKIYWTITGRYLGYIVAPLDELTKKKHIPFCESDYRLLHHILSDSLSLLSRYSLHGLSAQNVDGISGATIPDLTKYIVPDAAYTSYTLWHLVYGTTRDSLNILNRQLVTVSLLDSLFKHDNWYDRCWALKMAPSCGCPINRFIPQIIEMLGSENYWTVSNALNFIDSFQLPDSIYQAKLFQISQSNNFNLKRLALNRIQMLESLDMRVAKRMIQQLSSESPYMINSILSALENKYHPTETEIETISSLLRDNNKKVANNAYSYLKNMPYKKKWLVKKLNQFLKETYNSK